MKGGSKTTATEEHPRQLQRSLASLFQARLAGEYLKSVQRHVIAGLCSWQVFASRTHKHNSSDPLLPCFSALHIPSTAGTVITIIMVVCIVSIHTAIAVMLTVKGQTSGMLLMQQLKQMQVSLERKSEWPAAILLWRSHNSYSMHGQMRV